MTSDGKSRTQLLTKIANGGIAGVVGVSIVYPIDLVKTRLQNQNTTNGEKLYKNMLDCFKKSYRAEGYWGMYRGSAVNILLVTPEKAIKLTANDLFRVKLLDKNGKLTLMKEMTAGGLAGLCQTVVTTPMELLKIQMQLDAQRNAGKRTSALELTLQLLKTQGFSGLYRGCLSTILRDVSFSIIYFPLFAHLKSLKKANNDANDDVTCEAPFYWSFISGCLAGGFAAIAVNPLDVIKTRLQADNQPKDCIASSRPAGPVLLNRTGSNNSNSEPVKSRVQSREQHKLAFVNGSHEIEGGRAHHHQQPSLERKYKGVTDAFLRICKEEGWKAFYKGASCRILVIAPLFGIAQTVYYLGVAEYILGIEKY